MAQLPYLRGDKLLFQDTGGSPTPNSIQPCLLCCKPFWLLPFIGVPDQICPECSKTYGDCAKVVCGRCRPPVTICRLVPKVMDNGFYIRPRSVLHSDSCNICRRGLTESTILEITEWERSRRPGRLILSVTR